MSKKLDAEKWRVLCEKEELISFMADYAPYAPIRRITGGASKGDYELKFEKSDFPNAPYNQDYYMDEYNNEVFEKECQKICDAWTLGKARLYHYYTKTYSWKAERILIHAVFIFSAETANQYRAEYAELFACEKPESAVELKQPEPEKRGAAKPKRVPKRKAPNGAFTGWKSNRLGTKQIKVCKW